MQYTGNLPHPFSPNNPYLRPQFNSNFVSVKSSTPWNVIEKLSIFTSRDSSCDAKTPVQERFDKPVLADAPFFTTFESSTPFSAAGLVFPLDCKAAFFLAWRFFAASEGILRLLFLPRFVRKIIRFGNTRTEIKFFYDCATCDMCVSHSFPRSPRSISPQTDWVLNSFDMHVTMATRSEKDFSKWR